jgi:hypothetical protein
MTPSGQQASIELSPPARLAANAACAGVLALEFLGWLLMWVPIPLAWLWIGGRLFDVTGSLGIDLGVAFFGFVLNVVLVAVALGRIDRTWIALRRRAGYEQDQGALARVAIISGTFGIIMFFVWYYVLTDAYVLPFMPSN